MSRAKKDDDLAKFNAWWNNTYFRIPHPLHEPFKEVAFLNVDLYYVAVLLNLVQMYEWEIKLEKRLKPLARKKMQAHQVERGVLVRWLSPIRSYGLAVAQDVLEAIREKYFPEKSNIRDLLTIWEIREIIEPPFHDLFPWVVAPSIRPDIKPENWLDALRIRYFPRAQGRGRKDTWVTFILFALTEHFRKKAKPKGPHHAKAMKLIYAAQNKPLTDNRALRQTAISRIKSFKKTNPDWRDGLNLLWTGYSKSTSNLPSDQLFLLLASAPWHK
jgi:hypothetical protein